MVNIKYLLIGVFVIGIIVAISPLYASDDVSILDAMDITPFSEDTIVTVDGLDFNIPKGYGEEVGALTKDGETKKIHNSEFITYSHHYLNDDGNSISVDIYYDEHQSIDLNMFSKDSGEIEKNIDGNDGLFLQDVGFCSFTYILDGKAIMLSAKNETVISDVII